MHLPWWMCYVLIECWWKLLVDIVFWNIYNNACHNILFIITFCYHLNIFVCDWFHFWCSLHLGYSLKYKYTLFLNRSSPDSKSILIDISKAFRDKQKRNCKKNTMQFKYSQYYLCSKWLHVMSAMASKIPATRPCVQQPVQPNIKGNIKASHHYLFVRINHRCPRIHQRQSGVVWCLKRNHVLLIINWLLQHIRAQNVFSRFQCVGNGWTIRVHWNEFIIKFLWNSHYWLLEKVWFWESCVHWHAIIMVSANIRNY